MESNFPSPKCAAATAALTAPSPAVRVLLHSTSAEAAAEQEFKMNIAHNGESLMIERITLETDKMANLISQFIIL